MKNLIDAIVTTFKIKIWHRTFYTKLLAYAGVIFLMKYNIKKNCTPDKWERNDDQWSDELPSIFNLDAIVSEMNRQRDDINMTLKLHVNEWRREEVKFLMDKFSQCYNGYCRVNNRHLTLLEMLCKLENDNKSIWKFFKDTYMAYARG